MVTSRKKYSLIAGNPLELYVLTDSGNTYRGRANHSDIVKSIKIGQSAAKSLPVGSERFNDYPSVLADNRSTALVSGWDPLNRKYESPYFNKDEDIVWTYVKT